MSWKSQLLKNIPIFWILAPTATELNVPFSYLEKFSLSCKLRLACKDSVRSHQNHLTSVQVMKG